MTVDQKITLLNEKLSEVNVKAVIVPTNDAHFSEYVSSYDKCREFISGFTGSAGTCVISHSGSVLWSDSRYFLQAEDELKSTTIQFMKSGVEGVPTIEQWLKSHLNEGDSVGFDAKLFSVEQVAELQNKLLPLKLQAINDPFDSDVWPSRPLPPTAPVEPMEVSVAGESSESKLLRLREMLSLNDGESYVVSMLDEIAWICNIRGGDVDYNPVVISYLIVESNKAVLFVDKQKVNSRTEFILNQSSIYVMEYSDFDDYIAQNASNTYMLNPSKSSYHTRSLIKNIKFESGPTAISLLKSQKNETEIKGFKQAMIEDGVALVKFYMWLEESLQKGDIVGEWDLSCKLIEFRSQSPLYRGESFTPIVGYKDNGAIVHYSVTPQSSKTITRDGFLLIDSGGQYSCGTTDITRTLHLSFTPTEQECIDFTLVLKGNLSLSMAIFPKGTRGSQLDILARKDMYSY
ncbi:MAG: aminopeptidase P family N-terminal domain-containing protein, partial [Rikenellaceae bacterium]